ncbi:MAG: response regulator [Bryobacteraceae bacterium]|nr:response regulator [Bryobacteraceae bacterium]
MGLRVLIVDDSPAMRAYVRRSLQTAGVALTSIHEAGDGQEASALVERQYGDGHWFDLILTDLNMPNVNGEEFLRKLRSNDMHKHIPVLIISTDSTQTRVLRLRELGAQGYVSKPCHPEMIRLKVEQVVGKSLAKSR